MKRILSIIAIFSYLTSFSQDHWESIILAGDQWHYLPATSQPPSDWYAPDFDDSVWPLGYGGIGYGDGDDATIISPVNSLYLRIKFSLADKSVVEKLLLDIDYDDAFIAYLNGVEIARSANVTANPPLFNSLVNPLHEALMYQGGQPERHEITLDNLKNESNTFALQILNESTNSSDLTSLIFLHAKISVSGTLFKPTPSWFRAPVEMNESNLPILIVNTNGQDIPDEPKIAASLGIINNIGKINKVTDPYTLFIDNIGIEIRGSSSQMFEKKNYGFETRTLTGDNLNISLLGLPAENDWVLHGPYSDKSLMRNALTYYLGNKTGWWAPRTRFCELYINSDYRGVYMLIEKIKRDNNRVDISKLEPNEITGSDLTGGYILSIDRAENFWISPYKGINGSGDVVINYIYPDYYAMPDQQRQYIRNYVTSFENALNGSNYKDPVIGYRAFTEINSFIDYFLINELSRNVDAYRLSAFFYKDKNGKLTMGPLWDYNLAFGNANYYEGFNPQGWIFQAIGSSDYYPVPTWWPRFRSDPYFNSEMKKRWLDLRQGPFQISSIYAYIDSVSTLLADAQKRNFTRFQVLGQYVWPNYFVGQTYQDELNFMKNWITQRLQWMDAQINLITDVDSNPIANAYETYAFPNPFSNNLTIRTTVFSHATITLNIYNLLGQKIFSESKLSEQGVLDFNISGNIFGQSSGVYVYELNANGTTFAKSKIVKQEGH